MNTAESAERLLTGWGRTSSSRATVLRPADTGSIRTELARAGRRGVLPRGLGRSYGDAAQNGGGVVLDMTGLEGIQAFDERTGSLTALAGTSLDSILRRIVPRGWFLPVTPGTRHVTLGGAIANDVHGKNHHKEGGFGDHVTSFDLMTTDGEERTIVRATDPEAFDATLGGLGLTGVITRATLTLLPIQTSSVVVDTERVRDLEDLMEKMQSGDDRYRYSVAWVDSLARGGALGRAVLTRGDHALARDLDEPASRDPLAYRPRSLGSVPPHLPNLVKPLTARAFSEIWFRKAPRSEHGRLSPLEPFFYPLDAIRDWNRVYGRRGFVQYQLVVPFGQEAVVRLALDRVSRARSASFLTVLKRFGPGRGMLSFPIEGWTLALDLPVGQRGLAELLDGVDGAVADAGGRVYLAKDSRMDPGAVAAMYPDLGRWREARSRLDPGRVLRSDLERRLRLDVRVRNEVRS